MSFAYFLLYLYCRFCPTCTNDNLQNSYSLFTSGLYVGPKMSESGFSNNVRIQRGGGGGGQGVWTPPEKSQKYRVF